MSRVVFGFVLMFAPGAIEGAAGFLTATAEVSGKVIV